MGSERGRTGDEELRHSAELLFQVLTEREEKKRRRTRRHRRDRGEAAADTVFVLVHDLGSGVESTGMADEPTPYQAGTTALVVAVPEAEPVVERWRSRYDRSASTGAHAHVTVLFPFLDAERIDTAVVSELARVFAGHRGFTAEFRRTARRPSLLCLLPEPADPFSRMTQDVVTRWPDRPPYGGKYPDTPPHLTVAIRQPEHIFEQVDKDLSSRLPFSAAITSVDLVVFEDGAWHRHRSFELADDTDHAPGAGRAAAPG
ncbi:hypothetical protein GCM10009550_43310 [Actinocorallia libanotica]|uniref:2'-5' RNA ligase superfamily protein n=2 Tax=Actinocorallia libanotica TaxID=46162 RepID=A0ABP4BY37_9ACTN